MSGLRQQCSRRIKVGLSYIDKIRLVTHVEVMDDRGLVKMCEFCHIVGLIEFGRIDLINGVGIDVLLGAIVTLNQDPSPRQILYNPSPYKRRCWISKPDIALAREVILALDDSA